MATEEFATKHSEANIDDVGEISLPYRVEGAVLMSPGTWNGIRFTESEMQDAFERTDWESEDVRALFNEHSDRDSRDWIGRVENPRMDGEDLVGDLVIVTKDEARKLAAGAEFGISPKVHGETRGRMLQDYVYSNFSLVLDPAVRTTFLNSRELPAGELIAQLQEEVEVHNPDFEGTADEGREWNAPDLEDFTDESWEDLSDDERGAVGDHFLISMSGFPADRFTDLKLPVVHPDGELSVRALRNAKARLSQVEGITSDHRDRAESILNGLAEDNFPDSDFEDEFSAEEDEDIHTPQGDNTTMSDNSQEASEAEADVEDGELVLSDDALDQLADRLEGRLASDAEDDGAEAEDAGEDADAGSEDVEDADADVDPEAETEADADTDVDTAVESDVAEFSTFYEEGDFDTLAEAAEAYEEAQKDPSEKIDEVKQTFEQKLDAIQSELEDVKESADSEPEIDAEMLSRKVGEQRKQAREKVEEFSKDDLDEYMFKRLMRVQGSGQYL